ncbi:uncharacterized protein B0J16DRAFT_40281 [Fusarium flagelliforme]|uniref:uncharacterized protein n=1 Tax=Fusarium flagelliforme TaxID=2675880 RepID=UPI001E8CEAE3|nr:uncharacterized protein B0J16DRAFT_40281 [Fusarium flagelliforme]KAH7198530.1 hypothetical protein B0J16DRAFT_40281 [Fusarium flagelliforme]
MTLTPGKFDDRKCLDIKYTNYINVTVVTLIIGQFCFATDRIRRCRFDQSPYPQYFMKPNYSIRTHHSIWRSYLTFGLAKPMVQTIVGIAIVCSASCIASLCWIDAHSSNSCRPNIADMSAEQQKRRPVWGHS